MDVYHIKLLPKLLQTYFFKYLNNTKCLFSRNVTYHSITTWIHPVAARWSLMTYFSGQNYLVTSKHHNTCTTRLQTHRQTLGVYGPPWLTAVSPFCRANQTMTGILNPAEEGNLLPSLEPVTTRRQTTHTNSLWPVLHRVPVEQRRLRWLRCDTWHESCHSEWGRVCVCACVDGKPLTTPKYT